MWSLTACHVFGAGRVLECHGAGAALSACEVQNGRLGKLVDLFPELVRPNRIGDDRLEIRSGQREVRSPFIIFSELAGRWLILGTQGFALRDSTFCESSSPLR